MVKNDVWRLGAVDVQLEENGLVQHGIIADLLSDKSLVIDFGYPGHHADVVSTTKCRDHGHIGDVVVGECVSTLFQRSPDHPWCWYPAKLLAYDNQKDVYDNGNELQYAFVEIDVDGVLVRDVVPADRVEVVGDGFQSAMKKYRKHTIELPDDQELKSLMSHPRFWKMWNREAKVGCGKYDAGTLTYIVLDTKAITTTQCVGVFQTVRNTLFSRYDWKRPCQESLPTGAKKLKAETPDTEQEPEQHSVLSNLIFPLLPDFFRGLFAYHDITPNLVQLARDSSQMVFMLPEILVEIVCYLDVTNQQRSRRVCTTWNRLLISSSVVIKVEVDLKVYTAPDSYDRVYQYEKLPLTLLKMVNQRTRALIITGRLYDKWTYTPFRAIVAMLRAMNVRVPMIVINKRTIWANDLLDYSDPLRVSFRSGWRDVCGKLALIDAEVRSLMESQDLLSKDCYGSSDRVRENCFGVQLKPANLVIRTMDTDSFLNELDSLCPEMSSQDLRSLRLQWKTRSKRARKILLQVLQKWQLDEPLLAEQHKANFRYLKVTSLRNITLYALQYRLRLS
ncbi:uncharacterized protein LOC129591893 [Paramacrobiotus metropolitanus]|uniref:uncharacterized protein LOC129591893 n=1 Tax=Paramacrobiotus metropolitanus TaxID=2943436 RepID=UPI002445A875|nr:uncharacterized protein LOC129591893 [Paramacrobiotus metropolitanus]